MGNLFRLLSRYINNAQQVQLCSVQPEHTGVLSHGNFSEKIAHISVLIFSSLSPFGDKMCTGTT